MLTTLTTRILANTTVSYKFLNNKLTVIIDTLADHNLFGDVKILLENCAIISSYSDPKTLVSDTFNKTFTFSVKTSRRLEVEIETSSGFTSQDLEIALPNDGSAIVATVNNTTVDIPKGEYLFKLIDEAASVFDSALVVLQEQDITNDGITFYNGISDEFDELGDTTDYESIDAQELTFLKNVEMSVDSIGASTNIAIFYTELKNVY